MKFNPPGERGEPGSDGMPGIPGNKGAHGEINTAWQCHEYQRCTKELTGEPGYQGESGYPGSNGDDGLDGEKGDQGEEGLTGEPGEPGAVGDVGLPGLSGDEGWPGDDGLDGYKECRQGDCTRSLGTCYGMSSATLKINCRDGYAPASIWKNSVFWGLECCQIVSN